MLSVDDIDACIRAFRTQDRHALARVLAANAPLFITREVLDAALTPLYDPAQAATQAAAVAIQRSKTRARLYSALQAGAVQGAAVPQPGRTYSFKGCDADDIRTLKSTFQYLCQKEGLAFRSYNAGFPGFRLRAFPVLEAPEPTPGVTPVWAYQEVTEA